MANRLIIAGYLIPLAWILVNLWIDLKYQNEAKSLGMGITIAATYLIILFFSFFSLAIGSMVSIRALFLDSKLRVTVNLILAILGIIGFFIIVTFIILLFREHGVR
jgi:hypothetical protein